MTPTDTKREKDVTGGTMESELAILNETLERK